MSTMMTSAYKILANRLNAQRSTGPRTVSGKRRASQNAFRHGLSLPAHLFPTTKPMFEEIYTALKAEIAASTMADRKGLMDRADRYPAVSGFLDGQDARSDPVARLASTILDLCRLRAARRRVVARLMEGADELTAVLELKSLARYGNRLNSQLKRPT
jgi:hypothetical protein